MVQSVTSSVTTGWPSTSSPPSSATSASFVAAASSPEQSRTGPYSPGRRWVVSRGESVFIGFLSFHSVNDQQRAARGLQQAVRHAADDQAAQQRHAARSGDDQVGLAL